jgi:hypothetical protein
MPDVETNIESTDDRGIASGAPASPHVQDGEVMHVAVRVPPFWTEMPDLWFAQIEAQFKRMRVTSEDTKFTIIVSQADPQLLSSVGDIIRRPPTKDPYTVLKRRALERYTDSEQTRLRKLIGHSDLGDRRPSELLREMERTAGEAYDATFIRSLWIQRLPANIRAGLATRPDDPTEKLANTADRLHEIYDTEVAAMQTKPNTATPNDVQEQIRDLKKALEKLTREVRDSRNQGTSQSRIRKTSRSRDGICFYHEKFGAAARKCQKPCTHKDSGNE